MLKSLKKELKNLIIQSTDELFRRLKEEVLDSDSSIYNDLIAIQARSKSAERSGKLGLINFDDKSRSFNNVNDALLCNSPCRF